MLWLKNDDNISSNFNCCLYKSTIVHLYSITRNIKSMETTTIKDKVLNGKNAQSIRATLKARTPNPLRLKIKERKYRKR
jgi:hypothetical protein